MYLAKQPTREELLSYFKAAFNEIQEYRENYPDGSILALQIDVENLLEQADYLVCHPATNFDPDTLSLIEELEAIIDEDIQALRRGQIEQPSLLAIENKNHIPEFQAEIERNKQSLYEDFMSVVSKHSM